MILEKALTLDARALRGLGVLRQADARAARGVGAAAHPREPHVRPRAERRLARRATRALLLHFSPWAVAILVARGPAGVRRGDAVLGRRVPRCSAGARPDGACKRTSRRARARGPREGGQAASISARCFWIATARSSASLYGEDRALTLRRNAWGFALGLVEHRRVLRRVRVDRVRDRARHDHARRDDDVPAAVQAGPVGGRGDARARSAACTRTTSISRISTSSSSTPAPAVGGTRDEGPDPSDGIASRTCVSRTRARPTPALARRHAARSRRAAARARRRERLGQDHADQAAHGPVPADAGTIRFDGLDLREWDPAALRRRIGVIFQDFIRYQLTVGENIGAGDVARSTTERAGSDAAEKGMADDVHRERCRQATTRSSARWFKGGRELSGGQWQKIALSRAFMRERRRHPRARRADRGDGRRGRGAGLRALPLAHRGQDRDPDLAPLLDRAHGRSRSSCSSRAAIVEQRHARRADGARRPLRAAVRPAGARVSLSARMAARRRFAAGAGGQSQPETCCRPNAENAAI